MKKQSMLGYAFSSFLNGQAMASLNYTQKAGSSQSVEIDKALVLLGCCYMRYFVIKSDDYPFN
ncbi:hypothetical protein Sez_0771 [Streptococcus equi subsp. zooepidemicus MGCS10565]|uniref:Uncharacterized protein n=1 Tax=Streptococcus equi subsp. zooepidemicus (strain MGCS10565) TaxID=552526 RepID=B4U2B5_STREM|nr:hypothetical protein Sez_0771 [Streptococcus equi subsp. zooepidemicus MGCS10565]